MKRLLKDKDKVKELFDCRTFIGKVSKNSGRNRDGKMVLRHRGGGLGVRVRYLDVFKRLFGQVGVVRQIFTSSNRTANSASILFSRSGLVFNMLCSDMLKIGSSIRFTSAADRRSLRIGSSVLVGGMYTGAMVHSIEVRVGHGGKLVRSAGTFAKILNKVSYGKRIFVKIRLPSKNIIFVNGHCMATVGRVSNVGYRSTYLLGKAGTSRRLGNRPSVRGVAMNPIDHPHGGDTSGGRVSVSKWGIKTKGFRTKTFNRRTKLIRINKRFNRLLAMSNQQYTFLPKRFDSNNRIKKFI